MSRPDRAGDRSPRPASKPKDAGRPVAIVTGANRGLGLEICRQLASRGYTVALTARDAAKATAAAREIDRTARRVIAYQLDVSDSASVRVMSRWLTSTLGRCDVLVNNAAVDYDTDARAVTADLQRVRRAMETNVFGAWATTQALLPLLRRSTHPRIVNVSSETGSISEMTGGTPAYAMSKAALNALTRMLAYELRADGVLVNAVCPGWTNTDMGRGGRPVSEGAASIVWAALLSDDGPTGGFFRDGRPLPW
jgi:NAD(P)-dependent dehydrogenase (short-subunit alcohol dehydrogenase family)